MPHPGRKKAFPTPTPQITNFDFGKWPLAEPKIREWASDHGLTPEEIELFAFPHKEHLVPGKDISILSKILSILIDEIGSKKKIASLEAIQSEVKEEWPALADIQGIYVEKVLRHTRGNKTAAARLLNIDRKTLDRMIKRHQRIN